MLPEGPLDDDPAHNTVHGLGNRKNKVFNDIVEAGGVKPYEGSVRFIDAALARGLKVAVVSSSRNAPAVLKAAGLSDYFPVVVDGVVAVAEGLPGKPSPATYDYAARLLGLPSGGLRRHRGRSVRGPGRKSGKLPLGDRRGPQRPGRPCWPREPPS